MTKCSEAEELSFDPYSHLPGPTVSWEQFPVLLLAFSSPHFPPSWQHLARPVPAMAPGSPQPASAAWLLCLLQVISPVLRKSIQGSSLLPQDPPCGPLPIIPHGHQKWDFHSTEDMRCRTLRQWHFFFCDLSSCHFKTKQKSQAVATPFHQSVVFLLQTWLTCPHLAQQQRSSESSVHVTSQPMASRKGPVGLCPRGQGHQPKQDIRHGPNRMLQLQQPSLSGNRGAPEHRLRRGWEGGGDRKRRGKEKE